MDGWMDDGRRWWRWLSSRSEIVVGKLGLQTQPDAMCVPVDDWMDGRGAMEKCTKLIPLFCDCMSVGLVGQSVGGS